MKLRTMLLGLICLGASLAQAEGELMVMPATLKVYNNHEHTVNVKNLGDAPLYLSISLQKVMNPGESPEKKQPISALTHPGMLASPDKLTLGPEPDHQPQVAGRARSRDPVPFVYRSGTVDAGRGGA